MKRLTLEKWNMISKYNHAAKWLRPFCKYTLTKTDEEKYRHDQYIPLWLYLLFFIPSNIAMFFYCIWDGGLKEFELPPRYLGGDILYVNNYGTLLEDLYKS